MRTFSVKNFERFQHYKDRSPPWIKLYNELLDDYAFRKLGDASRFHLIAIWLLASRTDNKIPYDAEWVSERIGADGVVDFGALERAGFIVVDQPLQIVEQVASNAPAKRLTREEGEGETEEEKNSVSNETGAVAPSLEAEVFRQGKGLLGAKAGGQIVKLRRVLGGDDTLALGIIEKARGKQNPAEWIAGFLKSRAEPETDELGLPIAAPYDATEDYRRMGVEGF